MACIEHKGVSFLHWHVLDSLTAVSTILWQQTFVITVLQESSS